MGALALLALLAAAGGIYVASGGSRRVDMRVGVPRKIRFESGSTPENSSRLRAIFASVKDEGGGVYTVTPSFDGFFAMPEGTAMVGASPITLFAAYLRGKHVGFAFGEASANAIHKAYSPITFRRSSQAYPSVWNPAWKPVYGDSFRRTVWGRFLAPHDETVASYMRGEGSYARADPDPTQKTSEEWMRLAAR